MKKLKVDEMENLEILNSYLLGVTKIDFVTRIEKCALDDKCTEVEIKEFLRKNYPGAQNPENLSKDDKMLLSLLLRYYVQKNKKHEKFKKTHEAIKLAVSESLPSLEYYDRAYYGRFKTFPELCLQD